MEKLRGPKFVQLFQPVLDSLRDLGFSARPREVYAWIAERHPSFRDEIDGTTKGGQSKFENKIGWARFYLAKAGMIDTEKRGIWVLTEKGRASSLDHNEAYDLFKTIHDGFKNDYEEDAVTAAERADSEGDISAPDEKTYFNQDNIEEELVILLRETTDKGFEELCARLLRRIGFEELKVTGKTGDNGVDGEGFLPINRFVRMKIMFQCKRYVGTVQVKEVRDFRGAIQGWAERGIFFDHGNVYQERA